VARLGLFLLSLLLVFLFVGRALWQDAPELPRKRVLELTTARGPVELKVEIAATPEAWARGLMFRDHLPEDEGMLFVFPQATGSAFWMKNVKIPLSVAFADAHGVILRILEMEPCPKDPCPSYYPGVAYRQALEVNRGWFARHGVREGDRWRLR